MTQPQTGTLLVVSGHCSREARRQVDELARALAARLTQEVVLCLATSPREALATGIRSLVMSGAQRLVVLPLVLSAEQDQPELSLAIKWAIRRWPFLTFHAAAPVSWQEWASWLNVVGLDALDGLAATPDRAAIVLAGAGCPEPMTNANLARLAHLTQEASTFARVDHAFVDAVRPTIPEAAQMLARLGWRNIVFVPWFLDAGDAEQRLKDKVEQAAHEHGVHATVAAVPLAHPALIDVLIAHHQTALMDDSFLAPSWTEIQTEIARSLGSSTHMPGQALSADEEAQLQELDRRINELLPPQYQGRYEQVSPTSMGTAPLKFGPDGQVAWDEIWTSFCDLALAGGPAHRGRLLEAVPAADALADPEKYRAVVAEIERGIRLVTGLPTVPSSVAGWVGVRCAGEEMAIWLLRAIIVENVMVRREGDIIYLPAGPRFTLKREIKNVVTVIAKTSHYWTAHLAGRRSPAV